MLYIELEPGARAPTCVWEEDEDFEGSCSECDDLSTSRGGAPRTMVRLNIIPAVAGRLLRFGGHVLHSVPKPANEYVYAPAHECSQLDADVRRVVLLFNTWSSPPLPFGSKSSFEHEVSQTTLATYAQRMDNPPQCIPFSSWVGAEHVHQVVHNNEHASGATQLSVSLMGTDSARRGCEDSTFEVLVAAEESVVKYAMMSDARVNVLPVE